MKMGGGEQEVLGAKWPFGRVPLWSKKSWVRYLPPQCSVLEQSI